MKTNLSFRPRRPLALACLCFILLLYLLLFIIPDRADPAPFGDKETITADGRVTRRERQKKPDGTIRRIVYLAVRTDTGTAHLQCYLSDACPEPAVGENIRIRGLFRQFSGPTNPGEFDAAFYYRVQGIDGRLTDAVYLQGDGGCDMIRENLSRLREYLADSLDNCLPAEDAGILRAMLLGDKSGLDQEIRELYQRSGIIHIIAISGLHISMIGMGVFGLLVRMRVKRPVAAAVCVLLMLCYGEMCGQTSPATRALVMFLMRLLAMMTGRCYDILTALALAAVLLVIEQPLYLQYSGFLLSFLAVLGVTLVRPAVTPGRLLDRYPQRGDPPWMGPALKLSAGFFSSLSVAITTLPVSMLSFHTFSVYSILLNLLVIPLMPAVILSGICAMLLGVLFLPAGTAAGFLPRLLLEMFQMLCRAETSLPGAVWVTGHAQPWQIVFYVLMLFGYVLAVYWLREKKRMKRRKEERGRAASGRTRVQRFAAVGYLVLMMLVISYRAGAFLKITILDVGQGDSIVVEYRDRCFLIDAGSSSRESVGKYVIEPFLVYEGISYIDAVLLSHEDDDHVNAIMELLEDPNRVLSIGRICLPDVPLLCRGENYSKILALAAENDIPVSLLSQGDALMRGEVSLDCLGPPAEMMAESNAHSCVLQLSAGDFSALFTGDVEGEGEEALLRLLAEKTEAVRDLTLLKVAHHGSRFTTGESFLERVKPRIAVISCGRNNRYGHPHAELLARLHDRGIPSFITAERGAVTVEVFRDSGEVWVSGFLDE